MASQPSLTGPRGIESVHPAAQPLLLRLQEGLLALLGQNLAGIALYGSLALGDFDPSTSDVDFVALLHSPPDEPTFFALQHMHEQIFHCGLPLCRELEGAYIPVAQLRRYACETAQHPHIDRGSPALAVLQHDSDWVVQRWVLRKAGITLLGADVRTLIDPISTEALIAAVRLLFEQWWLPMADDPLRLMDPAYQVYAVHSMPRILYTLTQGEVVSKPFASRWAAGFLPQPFPALLRAARAWQPGQPFDHLHQTRELIRLTASPISFLSQNNPWCSSG